MTRDQHRDGAGRARSYDVSPYTGPIISTVVVLAIIAILAIILT